MSGREGLSADLLLLLGTYDPRAPLAEASTLPARFYLDDRVAELERRTVFTDSWQVVGRAAQLHQPGRYLTAEVAGEPILVVRGGDGVLRAFYNVCRHHAAAVMTDAEGWAPMLRCPYHGWTYGLDGQLRGVPDFGGVCQFEQAEHGLSPVQVELWEAFVLVKLAPGGPTVRESLTADLCGQIDRLGLLDFHFMERRRYFFDCNWKVFVDNFLDGGYHVPHLHRGLDSVLDYGRYRIELGARHCLQESPLIRAGAEPETGAVRRGDKALYYWVYPNFMINWYDGVLDTNLVIPRGLAQTEVIFDFYFTDVSEAVREQNLLSIGVGQRIQEEDMAICRSVQRGLASRSYRAGRLSARREGGEHLFHRLLHGDLTGD